MASPASHHRWYRLTPDRLILALLAVEGFLLLSERFHWFAFNQHKGYTVLIALASVGVAMLLMLAWFGVALLFRWLVGVAALVRIIWTAHAAPLHCRRLLAEIAGHRNTRVRLLMSRLAKQPFASVGVAVQLPPQRAASRRAVIVLPESLCDDEQAVRWALAHEWTHIEHGDFRAWFVAGLARVLFFYQPLVWWLRRQLRLCQDYVADARASRQASQPEDYAEFLAARAAAGLLHPAMVGLGMGFSKSELYRRVIMLLQNRPLESRPPRLWTVFVTFVALLFVVTIAALTNSPQAAAQGAKKSGEDVLKETGGSREQAHAAKAEQEQGKTGRGKAANTAPTLESLGFMTMSSGPGNDEELDTLIKEKKYEFVKTFDSNNGEKQYVYRLNYPDGRRVNRNFSLPLEKVTSWADYGKKEEQQRQQRNEHISQALAAGRFRLLDLEVMQVHLCRSL
jgi:beta-lactamase regulating signal transducer with metallopeptidase domain